MPQDIFKNTSVIGLQIVEFHSWLQRGKKRVRESSAKPSASPKGLQAAGSRTALSRYPMSSRMPDVQQNRKDVQRNRKI